MTDRIRVVVTGLGVISSLGLDSVEDYWESLKAGKSGIGPLTFADATLFPCKVAGEVTQFDPGKYINRKEARRMGRFTQMAVAAAQLGMENAGLNVSDEDSENVGVLLGNGNGDLPTTLSNARILLEQGAMRVSPFFVPMILPNMAAGTVSRVLNIRGYTNTVTTACAAGTQAIGEAVEVIRRGAADVMFSGGTEAGICDLGLAGFCVMRALTSWTGDPAEASRPFDQHRDGFIPGEGAGVLILESLEHAVGRGATILAEIVGYGVTSDAYHPVQPDENGDGASRAIRKALTNAGITPDQIDYINAHGTSTPLNDAAETLAIKKALGESAYKIPISSTKSMIGHTLGAAGAVEAIACVKTINDGIIHPTINYSTPDPGCDLDYVPNEARQKDVQYVLSNSFGFGGQNACVIFKRYEE
jgi:3-oxoacyl-[acyl-carrier-protein] synthase II